MRRRLYLSLQEIGRDNLAAVSVEERERCAERRERDTPDDALSDDAPPTGLGLVHSLVEEVVEQKRFKLEVLVVSGSDVTKEDRLDDAATTPHLGNARIVQVPSHLSV